VHSIRAVAEHLVEHAAECPDIGSGLSIG